MSSKFSCILYIIMTDTLVHYCQFKWGGGRETAVNEGGGGIPPFPLPIKNI